MKKGSKYFIISLIFLLSLTAWVGYDLYTNRTLHRYDLRWYVCIEYLENGELYGGHPGCAQGPVIFYFGYLYKILFGAPQEDPFHSAIFFTMIGIALVSFFLIIKTLRHYGYRDIFLPWFIFIILVSMDPKIDHWLPMIFFFSGFYILYILDWKHKEYISAVLFSLSIATKTTTLVPLAFLLTHYTFSSGIVKYEKKSFVISKEKLLKFIKVPVIILTFILLITAYYPNIIVYAFLIHMKQYPSISLLEVFKRAFFTFEVRNYFIYAIIGLMGYFFLKTKKIYYLITSVPLYLLTLSLLKNGILIGRYLRANIYYCLILVFFPIAFTAMKYDFKKYLPNKKYVYYSILIILFIWPSYITGVASRTIEETVISEYEENIEIRDFLQKQIMGVLSVVPEQNGKILFEYDGDIKDHLEKMDATFKDLEITNPDYTYYGERQFYDHWTAIPLKRLLGKQYDDWLKNHPPKNMAESGMADLENEFRSLSFSLIIEGPPRWVVSMNLLQENVDTLQSNYCAIIIPDYNYVEPAGRHHRTLYFLNRTHCLIMLNNSINYYANVFESICEIDQYVANNIVLGVLSMNGLSFNQACSSGADWISTRGKDPDPESNLKMKIRYKREIIHLAAIILLLLIGFSIRRIKK